jgi:hypothetical protein
MWYALSTKSIDSSPHLNFCPAYVYTVWSAAIFIKIAVKKLKVEEEKSMAGMRRVNYCLYDE